MDKDESGPMGPDGGSYKTVNYSTDPMVVEVLGNTADAMVAVGGQLEAQNELARMHNVLLTKQVRAFNYLAFAVGVLTISVVIMIFKLS